MYNLPTNTLIFNTIVVLSLIIYFIVFYEKMIFSVISSLSTIFNFKGIKYSEKNIGYKLNKSNSVIFFLLLFSFCVTFVYKSAPIKSFLYSLSIFSLFFLIKLIFNSIVSWVNNNALFNRINIFFYDFIIVLVIPIFLLFILHTFLPKTYLIYLVYSFFAIFLLLYSFFFMRVYQMIITIGFTSFFYILYLCTIELFPIIFIVHFFLQYYY